MRDQRGDEVESGLVGENRSGLHAPRGAVDAGGRTCRARGDRGEVERPLAHCLAVVDVHAEPVSESVGHEHRHGPGLHGIGGRTPEQADGDESFGQGHVGGAVDFGVHHVGLDDARHVVVRREYDLIDLALAVGELSAHGIGARVVGAVPLEAFASGVAELQAPGLLNALGVEVMERFAVLGDDRGERYALALRLGDALDGPCDLALDDSRAAHLHGQRMHVVSDMEGALQGFDLLGALLLAHLGHGHHQVDRLVVVQQRGAYSEQFRELEFRLPAVGREVVDAAPQGNGSAQTPLEFRHGECCADADLGSHVAQHGLRACPDDVLDRKVVAVKGLLARIGVDHADQRRDVESEVVPEGRILPEIVGVVGIIVCREGVSGQQDDAAADLRAQGFAPCGIGFCGEHVF